MTETAGTVTPVDSMIARQRINARQAAAGVEIRIFEPQTQREASPGERGELSSGGYSIWRVIQRPLKTAEALDTAGWYHTGDIGSIDADGTRCFITAG